MRIFKTIIIYLLNQISLRQNYFYLNVYKIINLLEVGIGDWGLGIGDWGLGIGPNTQSPIPNPQSPIPNFILLLN